MARKNNSHSGTAEAHALDPDALDHLLKAGSTPDQACKELSRLFKIGLNEIALYKLEQGLLKFLFPAELKTAGSIPLSSSWAVSAHTATSKKAELFNNFAKVKHASLFESVRTGQQQKRQNDHLPIQKLISAPVLDHDGDVVGVVQICRKGTDLSCGPDFSLEELRRLELAAKVLGDAAFMQPLNK
jgi:hypothetical protein